MLHCAATLPASLCSLATARWPLPFPSIKGIRLPASCFSKAGVLPAARPQSVAASCDGCLESWAALNAIAERALVLPLSQRSGPSLALGWFESVCFFNLRFWFFIFGNGPLPWPCAMRRAGRWAASRSTRSPSWLPRRCHPGTAAVHRRSPWFLFGVVCRVRLNSGPVSSSAGRLRTF